MPSSQLYKDARRQFIQDSETRYQSSKDLAMLRDFLSQNSRPEDAQAAAGALRTSAGKKWGSKKIGDTQIPGAWIDKLMANIGNFVEVGNYAMTGAPESVGLAWFAVKLTLSAIQSNYDLYTFFGAALTDISEIMIIIPHYDRLYDERSKAASEDEWKPSAVVEKLFQDIIQAYTAVLEFSFSVQRHIGAGTLAKLRHGFKDFFGASKAKFEGKMEDIASCKKKILEDSQAIFQDKSLHQMDSVKSIVNNIEGTVNEIRNFQSTLEKMHEEQAAQWAAVLKGMEDIKSTTRPQTPWDLAIQNFYRTKNILNPQRNTSDALGEAVDHRYPGTCQWVFECSAYVEWKSSASNGILFLSGQEDSGKSVVLATIVEKMDLEENRETALLYLNCGSNRGDAAAKKYDAGMVCNTLLYLLYSRAKQDGNDLQVLEDCNKVFRVSKEKAKNRSIVITKSNKSENLPDFVDAFLQISRILDVNVIVALDETDSLDTTDQQELATKAKALLAASVTTSKASRTMKLLVGCRSVSKFYNQLQNMKSPIKSIDVGEYNDTDMQMQLEEELKNIPSLSEAEQKEAIQVILNKAGPCFAYLRTIAIPFMRQPFQRPLSLRLRALPEGMSNIYSEALRKMGSNYLELLRTALEWTLLAPMPLTINEVMDAYHDTYNDRGPEVENIAATLIDGTFPEPSGLDMEQLNDARGPFLRLEFELESGNHFIHLQDPPQIRDFCLHSESKEVKEASPEGRLCYRCRAATSDVATLTVSPKQGHLKLALHCIRVMNNPIFQRRMTNTDGIPLWTREPSSKLSSEVLDGEAVGSGDFGVASDRLPDSADSVDEREFEQPDETAEFDPDESQDDEDRGEINLASSNVGSDKDLGGYPPESRTYRYELACWSYHIREAEALWTIEERSSHSAWSELFHELDYWVSTNIAWFRRWQQWEPALATCRGELSPLHIAAYLGLTSWAAHLLENGSDVNDAPFLAKRQTPLHCAAIKADNIAMLKLLLKHGADPNIDVDRAIPPFHRWLMNKSDLEYVQVFLEYGADPVLANLDDRWTALHCFAWRGADTAVLNLLLDHATGGQKPNINARDHSGNSPLHVLLWQREVPKALLQAFVDRGANVNEENNDSARPLQMACSYGDLEALKILCHDQAITEIDDDDSDGDTALQEAATFNHIDCVKFLLELGANPNLQNHMGRTALHNAAWQGTLECVQILLTHGANPTLLDLHNRSPLFFACLDVSAEDKALTLLETLLSRQTPLAQINAPTKSRRTPLREAAAHGFQHIVEKLIRTADAKNDRTSLALNERDHRKGMTPLHRAAWLGKEGCVRLLLAAGADVTIRDNAYKTPLVLAYEQWALASHQSAFESIVSKLIEKDPKAAVVDRELTAICAVNGSTRLLRQLNTIGADLNGHDRYGWTPIELARHFQQADAARFLKQQVAWAGLLPSQWAKDERTKVKKDGKSIDHTSGELVCVSTDKPLPAGLEKFYFEITIKPPSGKFNDLHDYKPALAIGFCTIGGSAITFPGWPPRVAAPSARSWGYHGDDGGLYNSDRKDSERIATEIPYRVGHTVGCGVNLVTQSIWFTRKGRKLEGGFTNVRGRLFPILGLKDDVIVETNFVGPFLWTDDAEDTAFKIDEVAMADADVKQG